MQMNMQDSIFVVVLVVDAILSMRVRVPKFGFCIIGTSIDILIILLFAAHLTGGIFAINWTMAIFQTLGLLLAMTLIEMYRSGHWTDKFIEERRQGELESVRLTRGEAIEIIAKEFRFGSGFFDDTETHLKCIKIEKPTSLKKLQVALGNVPLNLSCPCSLEKVLEQAVRYP